MIDTLVADFKTNGNSVYPRISEHYRKLRANWFRHVSRFSSIDVDTWNSDFENILYRALLKYNPDYDPLQNKGERFTHYFSSAINKLVLGYRRAARTYQGRAERASVSLSQSFDMADGRSLPIGTKLEMLDLISTCLQGQVKQIVMMRLEGFGGPEICKRLKMSRGSYWSTVEKLRLQSRFQREVSKL
jgi:DNA-directed RNA polymerase specialized sigma24 family protein